MKVKGAIRFANIFPYNGSLKIWYWIYYVLSKINALRALLGRTKLISHNNKKEPKKRNKIIQKRKRKKRLWKDKSKITVSIEVIFKKSSKRGKMLNIPKVGQRHGSF